MNFDKIHAVHEDIKKIVGDAGKVRLLIDDDYPPRIISMFKFDIMNDQSWKTVVPYALRISRMFNEFGRSNFITEVHKGADPMARLTCTFKKENNQGGN